MCGVWFWEFLISIACQGENSLDIFGPSSRMPRYPNQGSRSRRNWRPCTALLIKRRTKSRGVNSSRASSTWPVPWGWIDGIRTKDKESNRYDMTRILSGGVRVLHQSAVWVLHQRRGSSPASKYIDLSGEVWVLHQSEVRVLHQRRGSSPASKYIDLYRWG